VSGRSAFSWAPTLVASRRRSLEPCAATSTMRSGWPPHWGRPRQHIARRSQRVRGARRPGRPEPRDVSARVVERSADSVCSSSVRGRTSCIVMSVRRRRHYPRGVRGFADRALRHPDSVADAVEDPPRRTGRPLGAFLASFAEELWDSLAGERPRWTSDVGAQSPPWSSSGRPAMMRRAESQTPETFRRRGPSALHPRAGLRRDERRSRGGAALHAARRQSARLEDAHRDPADLDLLHRNLCAGAVNWSQASVYSSIIRQVSSAAATVPQ
jgi:hypothetical protein